MKKPTLTEIKKSIIKAGGEYKKLKMKLNGCDAYEVNGVKMTKDALVESFMLGEI